LAYGTAIRNRQCTNMKKYMENRSNGKMFFTILMLILCLARYSSLPFSDVDAGLQAYASHAHFSCPPFLAA
jgi:hypothetical protein